MIHTPARRYQITLWVEDARVGDALRLEFDSREDAERAFAQQQAEGKYRAGILFEWNKKLDDWTLLNRYPD